MTLRLAITPGEPAGIGPDVVIQAAQTPCPAERVVFGDPDLLQARAKELGLPLNLIPLDTTSPPQQLPPSTLAFHALTLRCPVQAGNADARNSPYVMDTLRAATQACLEGHCDALVTGPVHKGLIHEAGIPFSGHTEFLAEYTQSEQVVMLLAAPGLRVALATTHLPLKEVAAAITPALLENILLVLDRDLARYFCKSRPHIFVCGLNPHAGDHGALGREEMDIIIPTLDRLRAKGLHITGPLSADTIFSDKNRQQADVFLAMYHDQGLPVLKSQGFGEAVNVTLGLNIIRTSVDHGTAFELAGTGRADNGSFHAATQMAITMCEHRHQHRNS